MVGFLRVPCLRVGGNEPDVVATGRYGKLRGQLLRLEGNL